MAKEKQDNRPNPDELLGRIQKETRGKLTVFLGAAAGVGKTYTMLEAAHERLAEGIDVVIGWLETHGRAETEKLVNGLHCIAPKTFEYRDKELKEMDIDGILTRKPELVLVDELAHTNVAGSRHVRRFQDVEEILQAGINVYTTINIQHIESLNDVVAQITGVIVRETVPDYIIEQADNVQLIDIPPEELIKRLKEGKVYVPSQAERALRNFFRQGNINALRELALRFTAQRVDIDLAEYMREHQIAGPWPAAGRVMVCVSASPFSAQLIRAARRLAGGLHAEFLAVYIETSRRRHPMGEKERDRLARNLCLAEELGAQTLTVIGDNLTQEIVEVARNHNVTSIVVGKPRHSRLWELLHGSLVDKLIRSSGGINVYVIQGAAETEHAPTVKTAGAEIQTVNWLHYAGGLTMTAVVTVVGLLFERQLEVINIALFYLLPVLLTAVWWGRWPSYVTAVASVLMFDFLFVPPIFTFTVNDIRYLWSFITFLAVSFIIGGRTESLRLEAKAARQREKSTLALYEFSREIAAVTELTVITQGLACHAGETIGRKTAVLLPDENKRLVILGAHDPEKQNVEADLQVLNDAEVAVAAWAYQHGQVAGCSTETLPGARYLYVPLLTRGSVTGIFGVNIGDKKVTPEERRLIDAWAGLAAIALERVNMAGQEREAELLVESDRLRTAVLNSISHELKTPLAAITGSVSALIEASSMYSDQARQELLETIQGGAARMGRVVANLLDTARLESGMLKLKIDWCEVEDVIGSALRRIEEVSVTHQIKAKISPNLPLIRADCVLLEQVLVNLLDNAIKYSPMGSVITIIAAGTKEVVKISVLDRGCGIPEHDLTKIFDKFYRVKQPAHAAGTGLGLSICKGIIEAHDGQIWAENRQGKGSVVSISLPVCGDGCNILIE